MPEGGDSGGNLSPSPASDINADSNSNSNNSGTTTTSTENLTAFEQLFANGPLPAKDTNELWGYIDISGNWVIPPSFRAAKVFWSSGLTLAQDMDFFE